MAKAYETKNQSSHREGEEKDKLKWYFPNKLLKFSRISARS